MENLHKNYWLFGVSEKWDKRIDFCKATNTVFCGWNIGLSVKSPQQILAETPEASRMATKFYYLQEEGVLIMANHRGIEIEIAKTKKNSKIT